MGTVAVGWIDDINYLATAPTPEEACQTLSNIGTDLDRWTESHASKCNKKKFQMLVLPPPRDPIAQEKERMAAARVRVGDTEIAPMESINILGVHLDPEVKRSTASKMNLLKSFSKSTWGLGLYEVRYIYTATLLPAVTYCCSVWWRRSPDIVYKFMKGLQKEASRQITKA